MFARQIERQFAVAYQCQLLSISIVNGIEQIQTFCLFAHFAGQIRHQDCLDVHGSVLRFRYLCRVHILPLSNVYRLYNCLGFCLGQVYVQQPVFHQRLTHFDTIRQHKAALELAACDAAV